MATVTVLAASVTATTTNPITTTGNGGETITAGQPVYLNSADNELYKAVNTAASTAAAVGISNVPSADGKGITYYSKNGTVIDLGATLTEDTWYIVSSTAGAIEPVADSTSGDYRTWLGFGDPDGNLVMWIIATGRTKT